MRAIRRERKDEDPSVTVSSLQSDPGILVPEKKSD